MAMSDRQFAAAHDRYLEPPDITDDESEDDEMTLASIYKQQQRDWEDYQAEQYRQEQEQEDAIERLADALDPQRTKPFSGDILDLLEWAERDVLAMRQQLAALTMQCEKLVKWKHLMSYNDSFFGEHAGDLKRVVYEIDRSMPIRGDK